jgi:hypothetical protein
MHVMLLVFDLKLVCEVPGVQGTDSSTSQQLSQLAGGGSLSPYMTYLLLCDVMFWVLAI